MNKADRKFLFIFMGAFLWGAFVLGGYYLIHKPATPQQAVALMQAALDFGIAVGISGLAGGLGRRLFPVTGQSPLVRFALQAALGWGVLGLVWFGFGLSGLLQSWFGWVCLVGGWGIYWQQIKGWFGELNDLKAAIQGAGKFELVLWSAIGLLAVWQGFFALAPPVKWDTLAYHLELPRQYLAGGRFLFLVENPLWGRSQIAEMLYTWALSLRGLETGTMLAWCFGVVFILGSFGYVRQLINAQAGVVAVAALMAGYTFRGMLSWGYLEALVALYGLAVLVLILPGGEQMQRNRFVWIGVFSGLALGVKFTAGLALPIVFVSILTTSELRQRWLRNMFVTTIWATLLFLPWLLKNSLSTGNPLYPHLWPTPWTSPERLAFYQGPSSLATLSWQDAWLPLAATWFGVEGAAVEGIDKFYADIGPLLVLFTVPGLIFHRKDEKVKHVLLWLGVGWLAMILGGTVTPLLWQTRYYYTLLPAAALAVGWGWESLSKIEFQGSRLEYVFKALILLVLGLVIWQDGGEFARLNPLGMTLGVRTREAYLDDSLGWYSPAMRALRDLPEESRVVLLWDERGLYAPQGTQADQLIDRWYLMRRSAGSLEAIRETWKDEGFSHLLVYRSGAEFEREHKQQLTEADWIALDELLASLPKISSFGSDYDLYQLTP